MVISKRGLSAAYRAFMSDVGWIILGVASLSSFSDSGIDNHNEMPAAVYPEVEGGGSLILAWQIRNKRVLVVGGGEV